jgi:hypothetical protein
LSMIAAVVESSGRARIWETAVSPVGVMFIFYGLSVVLWLSYFYAFFRLRRLSAPPRDRNPNGGVSSFNGLSACSSVALQTEAGNRPYRKDPSAQPRRLPLC